MIVHTILPTVFSVYTFFSTGSMRFVVCLLICFHNLEAATIQNHCVFQKNNALDMQEIFLEEVPLSEDADFVHGDGTSYIDANLCPNTATLHLFWQWNHTTGEQGVKWTLCLKMSRIRDLTTVDSKCYYFELTSGTSNLLNCWVRLKSTASSIIYILARTPQQHLYHELNTGTINDINCTRNSDMCTTSKPELLDFYSCYRTGYIRLANNTTVKSVELSSNASNVGLSFKQTNATSAQFQLNPVAGGQYDVMVLIENRNIYCKYSRTVRIFCSHTRAGSSLWLNIGSSTPFSSTSPPPPNSSKVLVFMVILIVSTTVFIVEIVFFIQKFCVATNKPCKKKGLLQAESQQHLNCGNNTANHGNLCDNTNQAF